MTAVPGALDSLPFVVKTSVVSPAFALANSAEPLIYRFSSVPTSAAFLTPSPVRSIPVPPS